MKRMSSLRLTEAPMPVALMNVLPGAADLAPPGRSVDQMTIQPL
jgi:hypothetical protein